MQDSKRRGRWSRPHGGDDPVGHCTAGRGGEPVAFAGKWVGWQTDPIRSGASYTPRSIDLHPINVHSFYPCLRDIFEIFILVPNMQRLFVFVSLKERFIISCGASPRATFLYLTRVYSC